MTRATTKLSIDSSAYAQRNKLVSAGLEPELARVVPTPAPKAVDTDRTEVLLAGMHTANRGKPGDGSRRRTRKGVAAGKLSSGVSAPAPYDPPHGGGAAGVGGQR
jgi:hypothetical protein